MISCFSCYLNPLTHHMSSSHFYETLIIGNFQKQNWKEKHSSLNCEGVDQIGSCHTGSSIFSLIHNSGWISPAVNVNFSVLRSCFFINLKGLEKYNKFRTQGADLNIMLLFLRVSSVWR